RGNPPMSTKVNKIHAFIGADLTAMTATIEWSQGGTSGQPPVQCSASLTNPMPITFQLGAGQDNTMRPVTNTLCGQTLSSSWNVQGVWDRMNMRTSFQSVNNPNNAGHTIASATRGLVGTATASTTFKVGTFTANPIPATINAKGMKDDASVVSNSDSGALADSDLTIGVDDSPVLDVFTHFTAQSGASGTLDDTGLTLLAQPGQSVVFSVSFSDSVTGDFNYWQASFEGTR